MYVVSAPPLVGQHLLLHWAPTVGIWDVHGQRPRIDVLVGVEEQHPLLVVVRRGE